MSVPPPAKPGSRWKVAGVVAGVVVLALLFLLGLIGIGIWRGWPAPLAAKDRNVLVTAATLTPYHEFVLRSDGETFARTRFFDGRTELQYRYDHPDPEAPFHLASRVIVAPTRAEAHRFFNHCRTEVEAAGDEAGYERHKQTAYFTWGDAWRASQLKEGEVTVGHVLACRRGEKVFCLELVGVGLDDSQFVELVAPTLQHLETWSP